MVDRLSLGRELLKIRPGTQVVSNGEQVGRVERVVIRPETTEVGGIIISGWIVLGHEVFVPIEAVEAADPDAVRVALSLKELAQLPPLNSGYEKGAADAPGTGWARAAGLRPAASGQMLARAGGWPLRSGQRVVATDGDAGTLDIVLIDPRTDRARGFVVRKGLLRVRDIIVPIEWVQSVDRDRISLSVPRSRLDELPEYRPDEEIRRDVLDALWYGGSLKPAEVQFVDVVVRDGIVELSGHTPTRLSRSTIEEVARRVRGVLDVENYLDTVEDLEAALREAHRAARQTASRPIEEPS